MPPVIKIQPLSGLIDPVGDTTYNINSRPTSITGDFGIIGDNGEITKVEGDTIVDESKHTVYNPVTNTTCNVTDWQYDYSTRTYNLTLDNGTTSTVTYGDENVTIQEGDTTYNVYYIVENSGSDTPTPSAPPAACNHSWTETSSTPPSCTEAGFKVFTCSLCNETKREIVPATGHTWVVKDRVLTQYDETGNLVSQGYTIYKCSVCGEEYRDEAGAGPPGGDPSGSGGWWSDAMGRLGDLLGSNGLLSIFTPVAEAFSQLWSWLPPEVVAVFVTGVTLLVAAAVLKFFL